MAISDYSTQSLVNVITKNQGFVSNEIEDKYNSHLALDGFCTVDNGLEGVAGDIRTIDVYGASGIAVDVAEGEGNTQTITTTLVPKKYQIKCAQAWFRYSDEALMRDPVAVQTGLNHLGVAMFNKVNADIYAEMLGVTDPAHIMTAAAPDFNCFVDAVTRLKINDAPGEDAMDAQQRYLPQVFALMSKADIAKARKALGTSLQYVEAYARTGYVGTVAGVNLYYKQDAVEGVIIVATRKAVTVFNKTGVNYERAARDGGANGTANTRMNDNYARKYYIAALTDVNYICKVQLTGDLPDITIAPKAQNTKIYNVDVSDIQADDAAIVGNTMLKGTSKWLPAGNEISDYWGAGNFFAVDISATNWSAYTDVKIGLEPTMGSGPATVSSNDDAVFKIADPQKQKLVITATNGTYTDRQEISLVGIKLTSAGA